VCQGEKALRSIYLSVYCVYIIYDNNSDNIMTPTPQDEFVVVAYMQSHFYTINAVELNIIYINNTSTRMHRLSTYILSKYFYCYLYTL